MLPSDILFRAIETAAEFNRTHGGQYLIANKGACKAVVISPANLDTLRSEVRGWFTAKALFEHVHGRRATHGELVNLGRQLAKAFPTHRQGPQGYYFVAPLGTPVTPFALNSR